MPSKCVSGIDFPARVNATRSIFRLYACGSNVVVFCVCAFFYLLYARCHFGTYRRAHDQTTIVFVSVLGTCLVCVRCCVARTPFIQTKQSIWQ